jgi:hypothetical protein
MDALLIVSTLAGMLGAIGFAIRMERGPRT